MARMAWILLVGVASAGLGLASSALAGSLNHPGRVTDETTGAPLKAVIRAWATDVATSQDGSCQQPQGAILYDGASDAASGRFTVNIDQSQGFYSMIACAEGYSPQTERFLPNKRKDQVVAPVPITLFPNNIEVGSTEQYGDTAVANAVGLVNQLVYIRDQNPDRFDSALNTYTEQLSSVDGDRAKAFADLLNLVRSWSVK